MGPHWGRGPVQPFNPRCNSPMSIQLEVASEASLVEPDCRGEAILLPGEAEVFEVRDPEQLPLLREEWNRLHAATPGVGFFHTYDWFRLYWKHYGTGRRMRVLVVRSGEAVTGIVPLVVQKEKYQCGRVRVLTFPLSDWGMWYGAIGPDQAAVTALAMQHLRRTRREWDMIDLRWTWPAGEDPCRTDEALRQAGFEATSTPYQQTSVLQLAGCDWEAYFASRSKKCRHELRRQRRALEKEGEVELVRHRPAPEAQGGGDPRWDLFDACVDLARRTWQSGLQDGNTICHREVEPFLRDCHEAAARLGMVDLVLLKLNGRPAAFSYNYHCRGELVLLRMGYDAAVSRQGSGVVMVGYQIEDSFARGDQTIDMGIGEYKYKERLRTGVRENRRLRHFSPLGWRSQAVRLTTWLKEGVLGHDRDISLKR